MKYSQHYSTRKTPQSEPIPGKDMVKNSAGGYVFKLADWDRLRRFLILGTEGGTYYVKERKFTIQNANCVATCLKADGKRVVDEIVAISDAGRAPSNDPALFALAMASSPKFAADVRTRQYAMMNFGKVARIGTHWFHYAREVNELRGWGRGLRSLFDILYSETDINDLAFQCVKYQQRDGWSHRDLLRLAHPKPETPERDALFAWLVKGEIKGALPRIVTGYILAQKAETADQIIGLINDYGLTREMIPTQWLNHAAVWSALLPRMPVMATVRNLGKMTSIGLLKPMNHATHTVVRKLKERVAGSRIHPLQVLVGLKTYQEGHGMRGSLSWSPVGPVVDALDEAFYDSFGNVVPSGKNTMLALDVSASMTWVNCAGVPITPRVASSAMAMVIARAEPNYMVTAFTNRQGSFERSNWGVSGLDISPRQRLDDIMNKVSRLRAGGTDCALPMLYAKEEGLEIDTFVILTDNETWAGHIHASQALDQYRQASGRAAKLVSVGMTSTGFTIADPNDPGMLDVVGFDTATPNVISEFAK